MAEVIGSEPPKVNPLAKPAGASTLSLKPIVRKPTLGGGVKPGLRLPTQGTALRRPTLSAAPQAAQAPAPAPAPAAPAAMDQLKSVTQKLKGITQEIPQQAILRKTGIIADQELSEAQKQAAKARTARISLSEAIGVAPAAPIAAKIEAAPIAGVASAPVKTAAPAAPMTPMKTIRIKRPVDLPTQTATQMKAPTQMAAPAAEAAPAPEAAPAAEPPKDTATMTQRKTLRIARPAGAKPTAKFGVKKPTLTPAKPAAAPAPAAEGAAPEVADIADIPDIPEMPAAPAAAVAAAPVATADALPDVPGWVGVLGILIQAAACVAIGALGYFLYQDYNLGVTFGGCQITQ